MRGTQRIRGRVNVVLNGLVREGVITGFRTNYDVPDRANGPVVTVTAPPGRALDEVWILVVEALMEVVIGMDVVVEPVSNG